MNVVVLQGVLARAPEAKVLASGDRLVAYDVTIRAEGQATTSVPVVWVDPPARAEVLGEGTEVVVRGRVRRRFFQAGGRTASRTEVVAEELVPARLRQRAARLAERARDSVQ